MHARAALGSALLGSLAGIGDKIICNDALLLTLESSYHSGYEKPLELGGAVFMCVCLSYFGGWRSSVGDYTEMVGHTGDAEAADSHEERFDHPARTWASATHKQFSMQAME